MKGYDILIMVSRYWFIAVVWFILLLLAYGSLREYRLQREVRRATASQSLGILTLTGGEAALVGRRYGLKADNLIGRARRCDIRIPTASISRVHAQIYQRGDVFLLSDSRSREGTFLNGERVAKPQPLKDGDEVGMGEVRLRVMLGDRHYPID